MRVLGKILLIFITTSALCSFNLVGQGLEIYLVKKNGPDFTKVDTSDCSFCFEPTKKELFDTPLIEQSDIEYFDWENQQLN